MYGNPLDFSKIYDIVMNDEIKLTYLLFSVYLFVLCSLGPFGAIIYRRLGSPPNRSKWPQTTQNKQVHAKQEVGQLYFIIHNNIIYF